MSRRFLTTVRRASWTLAVLLAPAPATAAPRAPRVVSFACHVDGRTRVVLPRAEEKDSYDELLCRASVAGLSGRSPHDLAVELRLLLPDGSVRVVASSHLEPGHRSDRARIDELAIPHATWVAGVNWTDRTKPRLRLELRLLDKPPPGSTRWRPLAVRRLDLGAKPATATATATVTTTKRPPPSRRARARSPARN